MAKDKEEKKVEKKWKIQLVITNEEQPPKKVFVKGEETLDLYAAIAKLLNELEDIKSAVTN